MKLPVSVKNLISSGVTIFDNLAKNDNYRYVPCNIKCGTLPDPIWEKDKLLPVAIQNILFQIPKNHLPSLYYFEIIGGINKSIILRAYQEMKKNARIERASAALKKNPPVETNVLYVGKVKKDIQGRIKVHLGYYHNANTSGLQLVCWAKEIKLELQLHVFQFEKEMAPFIGSLELPFSRSLNPMIGMQ